MRQDNDLIVVGNKNPCGHRNGGRSTTPEGLPQPSAVVTKAMCIFWLERMKQIPVIMSYKYVSSKRCTIFYKNKKDVAQTLTVQCGGVDGNNRNAILIDYNETNTDKIYETPER